MEQVWVRGYRLVMSAYQMARWEAARNRSAGQSDSSPDSEVRALRNAIEHLDEARFTALVARRDPSDKRKRVSIDQLPGKELFLGFGSGYTEAAFGVVDLAEVTSRARKYAHIDDDWAGWEPSDIDYENMGYHDQA